MTAQNGNDPEPSTLELKIIQQIEYYFGDFNLGKDKFLREAIKEDEGWVSLETLIKFNRLKVLSTDFEVIVNALKKSTNRLIEVNEEGKKIRRSLDKVLPENDEAHWKEVNERSVYVKGFPKDSTLDELLEYFKQYGPIDSLLARRMKNNNREFKGSVFVVFPSKESAEAFLKLEDLKYNDEKLLIEAKNKYYARKQEEKNQAKEKRKQKQESIKEKQDPPKTAFQKGLVMSVSGACDGTMHEHIKGVFAQHADVAFVDFFKGSTKGLVRFKEGNLALDAIEKVKKANDGKVIINGGEVTVEVLEGDEEAEYWKKHFEWRAEHYSKHQKGFRGKKGTFKGQRWNKGGGRKNMDEKNLDQATGGHENELVKKQPESSSVLEPAKQDDKIDSEDKLLKRKTDQVPDSEPLAKKGKNE